MKDLLFIHLVIHNVEADTCALVQVGIPYLYSKTNSRIINKKFRLNLIEQVHSIWVSS